MSSKSLTDVLSDFVAEDGMKWEKWHFSAPLFEEFYILGPKNFSTNSKPTILYRFPEDKSRDDNGSLDKFVFADGQYFKNLPIKSKYQAEVMLADSYNEREELVMVRSEGGFPVYTYCLRFRGSAFTRPSLTDPTLIEEAQYFREANVLPSCYFAMCFLSTHPLSSILFPILNLILDLETKFRISAENLYSIAQQKFYRKSGVGTDLVYWPDSIVDFRRIVLNCFYQTTLPTFGEKMGYCIGGGKVDFLRMPREEDMPLQIGLWGLSALVDWISLDDFIKLLAAVLTEHYIVVVGSDVVQISKCVTTVPQLIKPLQWIAPVITLIPRDLLDILESPMNAVVGVNIKYAKYINPDSVIINLDEHRVIFPENPIPEIPKRYNIESMLEPIWMSRGPHIESPIATTILRILAEFLNTTLVRPIVDSLITKVGMKVEGTMFIQSIFDQCYEASERPFIAVFMETQLFMAVREQLCLQKTSSSANVVPDTMAQLQEMRHAAKSKQNTD